MIKEILVAPYYRRMFCDNCGEEMVQGKVVLTSYPPQYNYQCPNCRNSVVSYENLNQIYYKEIENDNI